MANVLLGMLMVLGIIVVGFLILVVSVFAIYAILYVIYKLFLEQDNRKKLR